MSRGLNGNRVTWHRIYVSRQVAWSLHRPSDLRGHFRGDLKFRRAL